MAVVVPANLQPVTLPEVKVDTRKKEEAAERWEELLQSVADILDRTQPSGRIVVASTSY